MKHYEQILSKVSPTFYKLIQYRDYFDKSTNLIFSYLRWSGAPEEHLIYLYLNDINYYYYFNITEEYFSYPSKGKTKGVITITLTTKGKISAHLVTHLVTLEEFIASLIINNFSFENEYEQYLSRIASFKDFFIYLVGKDIYETIRQNIK